MPHKSLHSSLDFSEVFEVNLSVIIETTGQCPIIESL